MASRSDSGNETRGSSESDNSPTPTKDLQSKNRFSPSIKPGGRSQIPTPILIPPRPQVNTRTTPVSRTTPVLRSTPKAGVTVPHRFTPTTTAVRAPIRPLQRRAPSSGMGTAASVHTSGPLGPLASSRGRQRNSVAIVDSREHIYEELEISRCPPKIAPVSGVLQQGKVVIRPIAFKPIANQHFDPKDVQERSPVVSDGRYPTIPARPDPRYTSTPTLSRGQVQHYGSMGDLKTLSHNNNFTLDRKSGMSTITRTYKDAYADNSSNSKFNTLTKLNNNRNTHLNARPMVLNNTGQPNGRASAEHSPPSYPQPPPRPPSHQSTSSNVESSQRYSYDQRIPSSYAPVPAYDSKSSPGYSNRPSFDGNLNYQSDLPRFESLRNLNSEPQPSSNGFVRLGGSVSNLTRLGQHSGSVQGLDRSVSVTGSNIGLDRPNIGRGPINSVSGSLNELCLTNYHQTPSPSDSGVAELEAMLREKDTEITSLKETMEQNEQVIFKVYEQKEKTWERELKKIRDLYDSRLKAAQQKALKAEQTLSTSTYQLQQEKRKIAADLEEIKREKDISGKQVDQLKSEIGTLRSQLEETEWGICQKSGEISLLKTQLKDSQGDQTTRGHELLHLRAQVRQYQQEVERRRAESASLHDVTAQLRRECSDWRSQAERSHTQDESVREQHEKSRLENESHRREIEMRKAQFEEERKQWTEEKERVIRYQKQLHHNYMTLVNRNRHLEKELSRITGAPPPTSINAPPLLPYS